MPYIDRNESGSIVTQYARKQREGQEFIETDNIAVSEQTNKQLIESLESTITARRMREALLGDADSIAFVADVESQIESLRQ